MRRIAFINEKGGTCKTTLCVNSAAWLARRGHRVLLVDLDTQGHAAKSLGLDIRGLRPTLLELLTVPSFPLDQVIRSTALPGLSVIPANKDMVDFPLAVAGASDRTRRLRDRLAGLCEGSFEFVLFDAPPSLSLVTMNAMLAADEVVIPVVLTYLALDGCAEVVRSMERLRAEHGHSLRLTLVVPALYRKTRLADEILMKLREHFPREIARTLLGYSVKIDEAQSHGKTIFEHAPQSSGARQLAAVAQEILERAPGSPAAAAAG